MISIRLFAITIALFLVSVAGHVAAREIYVDNVTGDDRSSGLSPESGQGAAGPIRTIAKALRICSKGDRIVLANRGVPYRETIGLSAGKHSGLPGHPFTIIGNGAILDGTLPVPPRAWEFVKGDVFSFQPERIAYQQLYLDGKPALRKTFAAPDSTPLTLTPLEWMLHEGRLYFRPEKSRLPEDYDLRYMGLQTGITLYHVRHVRIENLIVQGFQLDGVNLHDGCNQCVLIGVTARGNGRSGVSVGGSSRGLLENCVLGDNGHAQLRTEGFCIAEVNGTEIVSNTAPAFVMSGGRLFVDGAAVTETGN